MKYTKEILDELVPECTSFAELARKLNIAPIGSNTTNLSNRCRKHGVDTSHFTGQAHMKSKPAKNRLTADDILVVGTKDRGRVDPRVLTRALIESGVDYICEICHIPPVWQDKPLKFQVDHKDGQYWNNVKGNLRFVCPNCHTQTDNWGKKNRDREGNFGIPC